MTTTTKTETWTLDRASGTTRTYHNVRRLPHMRTENGDCYAGQSATGLDVTIVIHPLCTDRWAAVYTRQGRAIFSGRVVSRSE